MRLGKRMKMGECVSGTMTKRRDDAWSSSLVGAGGLIINLSNSDTNNTYMAGFTEGG